MFAALKRLGVIIVFTVLALGAVPSTALAGSALARELELVPSRARPREARSRACAPGSGRREARDGASDLARAQRAPPCTCFRDCFATTSSPRSRPTSRSRRLDVDHRKATDWWIPFVRANGAVPPGPGKPLTIIDTGVDLTHEEFAGRPFTTPLNRQSTSGQDEEHGTAVASVAAAPMNGIGSRGRLSPGEPAALGREPSGHRDHCGRRHPRPRRRDPAAARAW